MAKPGPWEMGDIEDLNIARLSEQSHFLLNLGIRFCEFPTPAVDPR